MICPSELFFIASELFTKMQVHKQTEKSFREKSHIALLRPVFYMYAERDLSKQVLFKVRAGCSLSPVFDMVTFFFPV